MCWKCIYPVQTVDAPETCGPVSGWNVPWYRPQENTWWWWKVWVAAIQIGPSTSQINSTERKAPFISAQQLLVWWPRITACTSPASGFSQRAPLRDPTWAATSSGKSASGKKRSFQTRETGWTSLGILPVEMAPTTQTKRQRGLVQSILESGRRRKPTRSPQEPPVWGSGQRKNAQRNLWRRKRGTCYDSGWRQPGQRCWIVGLGLPLAMRPSPGLTRKPLPWSHPRQDIQPPNLGGTTFRWRRMQAQRAPPTRRRRESPRKGQKILPRRRDEGWESPTILERAPEGQTFQLWRI